MSQVKRPLLLIGALHQFPGRLSGITVPISQLTVLVPTGSGFFIKLSESTWMSGLLVSRRLSQETSSENLSEVEILCRWIAKPWLMTSSGGTTESEMMPSAFIESKTALVSHRCSRALAGGRIL